MAFEFEFVIPPTSAYAAARYAKAALALFATELHRNSFAQSNA